MKNVFFIACLFFALLGTPHLRAEDNDAVQGISIYSQPQDFAEAQRLALQNRVDRINSLQDTIRCIQVAQSMDDIRSCQKYEHDNLEKVRLVYCKTNVARPLKGPTSSTSVEASECDKATTAVTAGAVAPDHY